MEEKVGWRRAFSAAIVLGLYSGFMITIGILSSIGTEYFVEAFVTWGSVIILSTIILTPILANGRKRGVESSVVFVERYRELLSQYNEGVGGWRSLSHVRDSGSGVLITLSDSSNPLLIIGKIASSEIDCKIIFRFSKREPEFRDRVLGILEEKFVDNRVQKKAKSIHINPKQEIDRNSLITKFVMICPPLILLASIGFNEMTSNLPISTLLGFIVGGFLGGLIATNRTH